MSETTAITDPTPQTPPAGTVLVSPEQGPGSNGQGASNLEAVNTQVTETKQENINLSLQDPSVPAEDAEVQYYQPTGDPGLDVALQFVGTLGFGADHPAIKAATTGNFAPLKTALGKMGERAAGYEPFIQVAEDYAARTLAKHQESTKATEKAVVAAVGGASNWQSIQKWAAENADPAEKEQINAAFKAGPIVAAAMAQQLAAAFKQSGKSNIPAEQAVARGASAAPAGTNALSPAEYRAELSKLQAKHGWSVANTPEYASLKQRRLAYRG